MGYFLSRQAEYNAMRLAQIFHPATVNARRNGMVIASYNNHLHLFTLENDQLKLVDSADIVPAKPTTVFELAPPQ